MSKGELTRQSIVQHAVGLASILGLDGLSIGKLASDLQLSKSGLFAHFRSKEELQIQVLDAAASDFQRAVSEPLRAKRTAKERLELLYDRWLAWGLDNRYPGGCIFVAAAFEKDDHPGAVRDRLMALQGGWIKFLALQAQLAIDEGYFSESTDPEGFAQEAYGIVLGFYFFHRLMKDPKAEKKARSAYRALLERYRGSKSAKRRE